MRMKEFDEVVSTSTESLDKNSSKMKDEDIVDILRMKRDALFELDRLDDALECSNEVLKINRSSHDVVWEGWVLNKLDRMDEAKNRYDEAIKISPDSEEGYRYMGWILMDEKKWTKAIEYLKKACDKTTENVDEEDLAESNRAKKRLNHTRLYEGRALKLLGLEQSDIAAMTEKMKEAEAIFDSILDARELAEVADRGCWRSNDGKRKL